MYIKINPNSFNIIQDELAVIAPGKKHANTPKGKGPSPIFYYPMNYYNTQTLLWEDYSVPAGSRIVMSIKQSRNGVGCSCEER